MAAVRLIGLKEAWIEKMTMCRKNFKIHELRNGGSGRRGLGSC